MKQEEVLKGNELIGKFMDLYLGAYPYYNDTIPEIYQAQESSILFVEDMKYHISWDWLIPVVKKIYQTEEYYVYNRTPSQFQNEKIELTTNIKQVYESVVDFIDWYNKQSK